MQSKRNNKGFSLAETMLVVAIIVILAALAFINIFAYQRSMTKLEYDGYAREIFIAAQNHLTMAESQGYLGLRAENGDFGTEYPEGSGIYYFVVSGSTSNTGSLLDLMLPVASIDETLRGGGCFIVRYHKDSATVLDVFYWTPDGSRFALTNYDDNYSDFLAKSRLSNAKALLSNYAEGDNVKGKAVIGWYGGEAGANLSIENVIKAPSIRLVNEETLYVLITDNNGEVPGSDGYQLKLILTGATSGKSHVISITGLDYDTGLGAYKIVLDDITDDSLRFYKQFCSSPDSEKNLIPGENISVRAMAYKSSSGNTGYNVAYSPTQTTNSLFASGSTTDTAKIAYFRHLENLDDSKSKLSCKTGDPVHITKAQQVANLKWEGFTGAKDASTPYQPVSPKSYALEYDGGNNSISDLNVSSTGSAGMFGDLTVSGTEIKNMKLMDLTVSGADAGALAGTTNGTNVTNVVAYNSKSFDDSHTTATVTGSGSVGGLIGSVSSGKIEKCAAALLVKSTGGDAGGLIGSVSGSGSSVSLSYSGGHTTDGEYKDASGAPLYNVTATGSAGGLIGDAGSAMIKDSYSTCSVSGTTAGGFVGTASGSITNCYATGLIDGDATTKGAFAGTLSGTASGCHYYKIINEIDVEGGENGSKGYTYRKAVNGTDYDGADYTGITAFDDRDPVLNKTAAQVYDDFVGAPSDWESATPYDTQLYLYKGKYSLRGLKGTTGVEDSDLVATHYGDWPAPEVWVINK